MRFRVLVSFVVGVSVAGALSCGPEVTGGRGQGDLIYGQVCSRCHGRGGKPPAEMTLQLGVPDLTIAAGRLSDQALRERILGGSSKGMPGFAGVLTDEQVEALIAYLRTLAK